jgi:hypothetical protein
LVDVFNAAAAFARIEQRLLGSALSSANSTTVDIIFIGGVGEVVVR